MPRKKTDTAKRAAPPLTAEENNQLQEAQKNAKVATFLADRAVDSAFLKRLEEQKAIARAQNVRRESARLITDLYHHRKALTLLAIEMQRLDITDAAQLKAEVKRLTHEIRYRELTLNDSRFKPSEGCGTVHDPTPIRFLGGKPINPD